MRSGFRGPHGPVRASDTALVALKRAVADLKVKVFEMEGRLDDLEARLEDPLEEDPFTEEALYPDSGCIHHYDC